MGVRFPHAGPFNMTIIEETRNIIPKLMAFAMAKHLMLTFNLQDIDDRALTQEIYLFLIGAYD